MSPLEEESERLRQLQLARLAATWRPTPDLAVKVAELVDLAAVRRRRRSAPAVDLPPDLPAA